VVEQLQTTTGFVPNSVNLDEGELHIITGPNMSGKSTLIRQVALMVLLAQTGSWVPAKSFKFGIVDKIFTRVGAFDRLAFGQSTFMLEMLETAHILHNATDRSLIILDEVGRGTSTFDGLSLAWAIAEHIVLNLKCMTMFATHYHQLSELAETSPKVKNFHLTAKERNGKLMLLYKIQKGATDHSFGISVAKMAGVPQNVILEAQKKLLEIETISENKPGILPFKTTKGQPRQLSLDEAFSQSINTEKFESELKDLKFTILAFLKNFTGIDINYKTPLEALEQLGEIVEEMKKLESKINEM
jgi:DNA mismatch repair protein MutS